MRAAKRVKGSAGNDQRLQTLSNPYPYPDSERIEARIQGCTHTVLSAAVGMSHKDTAQNFLVDCRLAALARVLSCHRRDRLVAWHNAPRSLRTARAGGNREAIMRITLKQTVAGAAHWIDRIWRVHGLWSRGGRVFQRPARSCPHCRVLEAGDCDRAMPGSGRLADVVAAVNFRINYLN